jgi:replicative superfamily II helicase
VVLVGIAFHSAGMEKDDRKQIEQAFLDQDILVLFATSTLAQGITVCTILIARCQLSSTSSDHQRNEVLSKRGWLG